MNSSVLLHQPLSEKVIRYSLNNALPVLEQLALKLREKGFSFYQNQKIGNYHFDFYDPDTKIALNLDGYAHEFSDVYSNDLSKKLHIQSLGITVFTFTDYQVLTDIDEIIRALKRQFKLCHQ